MNENLPITAFRSQILEAVENHRVVVITAETGAGKSTQVPQYLAEAGHDVIVTQPRRLAARSVAERVAEEMNTRFGGRVGYRTGYERNDSAETQVLFCTDGLQLVREITGSGKAQVLVIDEVHEWNINIETLVAWARKRLAEEAPFKVVIMSATLEADRLAAYFAEVTGECPVIKVPGRLFPVEKSEKSASSLIPKVTRMVGEGRNVLVFQPGKREIGDTIDELRKAQVSAEILPLHGQLDPSDQRRVFRHYDLPKVVVSTNVAQTSVTIDDIDAVVDSGLERRIELVDGVEGLYLKPTSQADCEQRAGRAGRTKEGVYILCSSTSLSSRPAFPVAEILRSRLDQVVLRLAVAGIDAAELDFFHQPDKGAITEAKRTCIALGFMTEDGQVTSLGRKAAKLPVGVKIARMVLEAAKRGCVEDVLTIAAIMETGSLRSRDGNWRYSTKEAESDLLAELDLWNVARGLSSRDMPDAGIFAKNYFKAKDLRSKLWSALKGLVRIKNGGSRQDILMSVVAGMVDHLYQRGYRSRYGYDYSNGETTTRRINRDSVVADGAEWVVGLPFDLQVKTRRGGMITLNLIEWVTKVDPAWLVEVAPQLSGTLRRNYRFNPTDGNVVCDLVTKFNGQEVKTEVVVGAGSEAIRAFAEALTAGNVDHPSVNHNQQVRDEVKELNTRVGQTLGTIESGKLTDWYVSKLGEIHTLAEALELNLSLSDNDVAELLGIEDYAAERDRIRIERPNTWLIAGEEYALTYEWGYYFKGVKLTLPVAVIVDLTAKQVPSWEGMSVRVLVADDGYTSLYVDLPNQELDTLREKIETKRREIAWTAFRNDGHGDYDRKEVVAYEAPLSELPQAEVWDHQTGATAHPAWVYSTYSSGEEASSTWYLRWYRTEDEALAVREKAEAKKRELDAAEHERRHFDELKAEAQALYEEVEALFAQIDLDMYQAYGLSDEEGRKDPYGYGYGLEGALKKAKKLAFGGSWDKPQPTQALEALTSLKARLADAQAYFAENETLRPDAEVALEQATNLYTQVQEAYQQTNAIGYDEYRVVEQAKSTAQQAFDRKDYLQTVEKADEVEQLAQPLLAKAASQLAAKKVLADLVADEYATCPVCGGETYFDEDRSGTNHWCDHEGQDALRASGQYEDFTVKETTVDGQTVVELVVQYNDRYHEFELVIRIHDEILITDPDTAVTTTHWRQPSEQAQAIAAEIAEVQRQLDAIEQERGYGGRVEGTFQQTPHGLQFEGTIPAGGAWVDNRQDPDGRTFYEEGTRAIFAKARRCSWLDVEPQAGETWISTTAFQIAVAGGKPVIVVNPQVQSDCEAQLRQQLTALQTELEEATSEPAEVEPTVEEGETTAGKEFELTSDLAARLAEAMGGRYRG